MERSEWLGKLLCQEPGSVLPERPRLSQVSGCPFRGSGWRRGAQGVSPARWASFFGQGDPCSVPRSPEAPEAGAGCWGSPASSLPLARSISPPLVSETSSVSPPSSSPPTFFRGREVGSRGNGRVSAPSLCRSTRRGRGGGRLASQPLLNGNSSDNRKNQHHL